jgi:hypothetical protein
VTENVNAKRPDRIAVQTGLGCDTIKIRDRTAYKSVRSQSHGLVWPVYLDRNLEIWSKDANRSATRYGNRRKLLGPDREIEFQLCDILDIPVGNNFISLGLDDFQFLLKISVKKLAFDQCMEMLDARARRTGNPD